MFKEKGSTKLIIEFSYLLFILNDPSLSYSNHKDESIYRSYAIVLCLYICSELNFDILQIKVSYRLLKLKGCIDSNFQT